VGKRKADICEAFGHAVRQRRLELGLTQEQLAAKAKLNRTYIGDIERGQRNIALRNVFAILGALEIGASRFFADYFQKAGR